MKVSGLGGTVKNVITMYMEVIIFRYTDKCILNVFRYTDKCNYSSLRKTLLARTCWDMPPIEEPMDDAEGPAGSTTKSQLLSPLLSTERLCILEGRTSSDLVT